MAVAPSSIESEGKEVELIKNGSLSEKSDDEEESGVEDGSELDELDDKAETLDRHRTLSSGIGILTTLKTLTLKGNGITGGIPESIGNLSSLTSLDLEDNQLAGRIPSSLGNLKNLQFLTLSRNKLNGTIPDSLTGLSKLINICAHKQCVGSLSDAYGDASVAAAPGGIRCPSFCTRHDFGAAVAFSLLRLWT